MSSSVAQSLTTLVKEGVRPPPLKCQMGPVNRTTSDTIGYPDGYPTVPQSP